jgi:hypothetical protein
VYLTESGAAGVLVGGVIGTIRANRPLLWATATGIQWSMIGGSYWGIRSAILNTRIEQEITPSTKSYASAISGGLSLALVGAILRESSTVTHGYQHILIKSLRRTHTRPSRRHHGQSWWLPQPERL